MASRPILSPFSVVDNESMGADITSDVTIVQNISMISYDISWTGSSPVGVCTVEVSDTYTQNGDGTVRNAGNWTALPISGAVSGNTGTGYMDIGVVSSYAIRLKYTRISGTGTMNATITGKVN